MSKEEIDLFFIENEGFINEVINNNKSKQVTVNRDNVLTLLYFACLKSGVKTSEELKGYIIVFVCNEYRWYNSRLNTSNRISHKQEEPEDFLYIEDDFDCDKEIKKQNRLFALEKYLLNAKPSERKLYNLYVKRGINSVRKLAKHLGVTNHAAYVMINEFKSKVKSYERKK